MSTIIQKARFTKILICCEFSGTVRNAFRKIGFNAWSVDLLPSDDNSPYHIQGDITQMNILYTGEWDLMIAHPPCTYLANSGVRWLKNNPERWKKLEEAARFFQLLLNAPIPHIAVENPIPHKYAVNLIGRKYDQIIQPYQFGIPETKAICLWLKNLPPLQPTNPIPKEQANPYVHKLPPSKDRWKKRSTWARYKAIADAMATQWGAYILNQKFH